MKLKIVNPGNIILTQKCEVVTDFNEPYYEKLIAEMYVVGKKNSPYFAGAAAPQFGIPERFFFVSKTNGTEIYFNPRILKMEGLQYYYEGCLSAPAFRANKNSKTYHFVDIFGKVARPYRLVMSAQDISGKTFEITTEGIKTVLFCHEADHLDGIQFFDKSQHFITIRNEAERTEFVRDCIWHNVVKEHGTFEETNIEARYRTKVYKSSN